MRKILLLTLPALATAAFIGGAQAMPATGAGAMQGAAQETAAGADVTLARWHGRRGHWHNRGWGWGGGWGHRHHRHWRW
jgi:hypothetical protein